MIFPVLTSKGGRRVPLGGCDPLALVIHELTTNASKYGALSRPSGHVGVSWRNDRSLELEWVESGGPQPKARNTMRFWNKTSEIRSEAI